MSWQAIAWAQKKGKDYELEAITRFVLLILANYADPEGNDIFPSLATLEADSGLSERTIRRHIVKLMDVGLMEYGDQSVVADNPRIRNDQQPKVYRFIFNRDAAGDIDFGSSVKRVPSASKSARGTRRNGRTQSPPAKTPEPVEKPSPKPVENPSKEPERPDSLSRTTGHTTGQRVHQTINPKKEPSSGPPADADAVRALRAASRARLAARGVIITEPINEPETPKRLEVQLPEGSRTSQNIDAQDKQNRCRYIEPKH